MKFTLGYSSEIPTTATGFLTRGALSDLADQAKRYGSEAVAASNRTETVDTAQQFDAAVEQLRTDLAEAGRDPAGVCLRKALEQPDEFESLDATRAVVDFDRSPLTNASSYIEQFADKVLDGWTPDDRKTG